MKNKNSKSPLLKMEEQKKTQRPSFGMLVAIVVTISISVMLITVAVGAIVC